MNKITILGSSGFIGAHTAKRLHELGINYYCPNRDEDLSNKKLGNIIYCIGITADFRSKPFKTVEAHVCKLNEVLQKYNFDSLVYLSSTRLYGVGTKSANEEDNIIINPLNNNDLYNISKVMGESILFASKKNVRIVRLSNVYGNDFYSSNFLTSVIKDAIQNKKVVLQSSFDSEKDYININDVVDLLVKIALKGNHNIYNVASGINISNYRLMERLKTLTGCEVEVLSDAPTIKFPEINIQRIKDEFGFKPSLLLNDIDDLVELYRNNGG